jgi:hypothetical protein
VRIYWILRHFYAILNTVKSTKELSLMSAAEQIKTLENRISELEQENKRLHDTVDYLTRKLFGRSSEKTSALSLGQMSLCFCSGIPTSGMPMLISKHGL